MQAPPNVDPRVAAVRRFNRFYTQRIGILADGYAGSRFSLTEARVLYELWRNESSTATAVCRDLGLDAGYVSRMLRRFQRSGLIRKETSPQDGRQSFVTLTARGRTAFAPLEAASNRQAGAILARLSAARQSKLVSALRTAEDLLKDEAGPKPEIVLREPRTGDLGWAVARHAVLYEKEFGWRGEFEGLCAQIVADFSRNFDPSCERCWIADAGGENAGSVFLVKDSDGVARLRLLLVEPFARGLGLGTRLTNECISFARACGYRRVTLWTHDVLAAARHTYASAGFRLTSSEKRRSFGCNVVSEHWDLELSLPPVRT